MFQETWHAGRYREIGIDAEFVQDNLSWSDRAVLRGLHTQRRRPQGKLVRVVVGRIFDVAVDIRPDSLTILCWTGVEMAAGDGRQVWVPPGYAHGFCALGERACVEYTCTELYVADDQLRLRWNDPAIGVRWPLERPCLSPQDRDAPGVEEALGVRLAQSAPRSRNA